jgi:hypothetical protein
MNSNSNGRHAVASLSSASTPRAHASAQLLGCAYRDAFDHFVASNGLKIFAVKQ